MASESPTAEASTTPTASYIDPIYPNDPYLIFQPSYAYSLPIQILLLGMVCTLAGVLLTHLICAVPLDSSEAQLFLTTVRRFIASDIYMSLADHGAAERSSNQSIMALHA